VSCPPDEQRKRLKIRTGLPDDQVEARIRSQMPMEEKVKYADYVIDTSGDLANTRRQVEEVNSRLRESAANTSGTHRS
jgi:dephospho-CoA kinase